jgi:septal ring factor EnvC (AmiA/AmiB activator)
MIYCVIFVMRGIFVMDFGGTLAIVNLAGLVIVGVMCWMSLSSMKQQLMGLMSRELAEVRRQMRNTVDKSNRQDDQITSNHEKIQRIEVNIASMQDELETMSRKLAALLPPEGDEDAAESDNVRRDERRHLLD